jgi:O-antigen/teichoic acid export membrane protein
MASRVEISKRLLLINSASSIGAQVLQMMVLLWVQYRLLDRRSAEEFGLSPLVWAVINFIPLFTDILTVGLQRYVIEAYAQGDENRVRQIVSSMFPVLLAGGLALLFGGGLAAWHVDKILVIPEGLIWDARLMMFLPLLVMAAQLPCSPLGQGLYVRQKYVTLNIISICSDVVKTAVLLALMLGVSTRVIWMVVSMFVGQMISLVVSTILSLRAVPELKYRYATIDWNMVRAITGFGGWNFLISLAGRLREYSVPLVLNRIGPGASVELTTFHIGSMARRLTDQCFHVMARPTYPIITGMYAMGARDRFRSAYLRGGRIGLWITLLIAIPAAIYAEPVIGLYTQGKYPDAATVMKLTLACYVLSHGSWLVGTVAAAKAQVRPLGIRLSAAQVAGLTLTVILAGWLGFGAVGAALATLAANAFSAVFFQLPLGLRLAEVKLDSWIRKTLVPGVAPACVAAVVWVSLSLLVKPHTWFGVAACAVAGVPCYLAFLLAFCTEPTDRDDLRKILDQVKGRLAGPPSSPEIASAAQMQVS